MKNNRVAELIGSLIICLTDIEDALQNEDVTRLERRALRSQLRHTSRAFSLDSRTNEAEPLEWEHAIVLASLDDDNTKGRHDLTGKLIMKALREHFWDKVPKNEVVEKYRNGKNKTIVEKLFTRRKGNTSTGRHNDIRKIYFQWQDGEKAKV